MNSLTFMIAMHRIPMSSGTLLDAGHGSHRELSCQDALHVCREDLCPHRVPRPEWRCCWRWRSALAGSEEGREDAALAGREGGREDIALAGKADGSLHAALLSVSLRKLSSHTCVAVVIPSLQFQRPQSCWLLRLLPYLLLAT